jgi:hypothetical protein
VSLVMNLQEDHNTVTCAIVARALGIVGLRLSKPG